MFSVVLVEHAYTNMMMEPVQAFFASRGCGLSTGFYCVMFSETAFVYVVICL